MNIYSESKVDLEQIKELIEKIESSKIKKIVVKKGDFELQLEKEEDHLSVASSPLPHPHSHRSLQGENSSESMFHLDKGDKGRVSRSIEPPIDGKFVTSPMVGTFYSSASPDQPPFVKVGDRVDEGTIVCIIEAMKVMNEVKANVSGVVSEILVENAHPVEFGSKMFRIG